MTNREIVLHLALLALLCLAGTGFYAYQKSSAMVPVLIRYLDSGNYRERQAATMRLQELGHAARTAAPRLLALTADPLSRDAQAATVALSHIDLTAAQTAMQLALVALRSSDLNTQRRAAENLGSLGLFAQPAVSALVAATRHPDAVLRDRSVSALARIGSPAADVMPALIAALDDPVQHVRHSAVVAMEQLPSSVSNAALPALQRLTQDPENMVRSRAEYTARRIREAHPVKVELATAHYMLARDHRAQLFTLHKIAAMGPLAGALVPELVALLDSPEDIVRYSAIAALGATGPAGRSAAPALRTRLADREPVISDAAGHALRLMGESE